MESIVSQAKAVATYLPRRDLQTLQINCQYHVLSMKIINTKFGKSIVVDLEDTGACPQTQDKKFYVYLPKRWSEAFTEEQLKTVKPCVLSLCVTGHTPMGNEKISVQLNIDYVSTLA